MNLSGLEIVMICTASLLLTMFFVMVMIVVLFVVNMRDHMKLNTSLKLIMAHVENIESNNG